MPLGVCAWLWPWEKRDPLGTLLSLVVSIDCRAQNVI
jgi:hypothetical protein